MTRIEFTFKITSLIQEMILQDESPIADFLKRSLEEQNRLFREGLSKCDGISKVSQHQVGKALDIYFLNDGDIGNPIKGYEFWHKRWEEMGGQPMIEWDKGHFEG